MRIPRITLFAAAALFSLAPLAGQKKKDKEQPTQVLQLPKELPSAVAGETRRLVFRVTPLTGKGLLSQQIRDSLKAAQHETGGDTILKIRAFVAGSADLRRVRDLVSDSFSSRKQPLPVLTLVRSGGLPLEGAQVSFEVDRGNQRKTSTPRALRSSRPRLPLPTIPPAPSSPSPGNRSMDCVPL